MIRTITIINENKYEKRINTDEMVARIGSWKDNNLQVKCAREAVKLIKSYISKGASFNQETTLLGKSIINNIKIAKEKGFYIIINYIGIENPQIAKERVRLRVSKSGQGIPDDGVLLLFRFLLSGYSYKKQTNIIWNIMSII